MSCIHLIRHPATSIERDRPPDRWELSEEGEKQLRALLECSLWSAVRHVYTSAEPKAAVVAEAVHSRYSTPFSLHSELNELQRPAFIDGYETVLERVFQRPDGEIEGWESLESALHRAWTFLTHVAARGPLPTAVVSHGIILSGVRARILGRHTVNVAEWRSLPFAGVAEVDAQNWILQQDFLPAGNL
jgi:broad specificity phosphatase PhoE